MTPQYAFGINIFASASVLNLVQPDAKPFQIAVPLLMTFSQSNPAFHFSMVTDPALLKAFKYSGSGAAANYFFPPVYFNGLPSKLGVRVLFQVVRAPLLITWAMFVVCMVSGLLAEGRTRTLTAVPQIPPSQPSPSACWGMHPSMG